MNPEKYQRQIPLACPTCGCTQFESESGFELSEELIRCERCGRELSHEELKRENSENINAHLEEIKGELIKDVTKELQDTFKKAFSGSKNIKLNIK